MAVTKRVATTGSNQYVTYPAASRMAFGAAVAFSSATAGSETVAAAQAETSILGLAGVREYLPKGKYDGFYEQYEGIPIVDDVGYALVTPHASDTNIDVGDFLEVCLFGDGTPGYHGVLEEAGSNAGTTFTIATVAKALQSVTMGSKSYKIVAADAAAGVSSLTMTSGELATMGVTVGDYVYLEDLNGAGEVNKVTSVSATVLGLAIPTTLALDNSDGDLVHRLYPCLVKLIK